MPAGRSQRIRPACPQRLARRLTMRAWTVVRLEQTAISVGRAALRLGAWRAPGRCRRRRRSGSVELSPTSSMCAPASPDSHLLRLPGMSGVPWAMPVADTPRAARSPDATGPGSGADTAVHALGAAPRGLAPRPCTSAPLAGTIASLLLGATSSGRRCHARAGLAARGPLCRRSLGRTARAQRGRAAGRGGSPHRAERLAERCRRCHRARPAMIAPAAKTSG